MNHWDVKPPHPAVHLNPGGIMPTEHHERLVQGVDELASRLESLPRPQQYHRYKPTLRKDWLTTPAEFLLLLQTLEEMAEHARRIGVLHDAFISGIREIAREAGVDTAEIEELGRARAASVAR